MSKHNKLLLRLCLAIVLLATIVFLIISGRAYQIVRDKADADANDKVQIVLEKASEIVYRHLTNVEVSGYCLASQALQAKTTEDSIMYFTLNQEDIDDEETIYGILEQFLKANQHLWGAAIGFEPEIFPACKEGGFAPFVRHADSTYVRFNLPNERNDYRNDDWYKTTKEQDRPRWSEPFIDVRGAIISCFCIPIHNQENQYIGTIAVDLQLDNFINTLCEEIHPYDHSKLLLLNNKNNLLVYQSEQEIVHETIASMDDIEQKFSNKENILYHFNVNNSAWTIFLNCTEDDIYHDINYLTRKILIMVLLGVLFMILCSAFIFYQIRRIIEKQKEIDSELTIASKIQEGMLSKKFPEKNVVDIHAAMCPAKEVGGDFYDFQIKGDYLYFAIGDVSGKGVPAAIVMAITKHAFRMYNGLHLSMDALVSQINNSISKDNEVGMFVTLFVGRINLKTREFDYCNAGHNPLVNISSQGHAQFLDVKTNIVVGIIEDFPYVAQHTVLEKDSCLVLYTDGVTEAERKTKELYGNERLLAWANNHDITKNATDSCNDLYNDVIQFANGNEQNDDITIMTIKL